MTMTIDPKMFRTAMGNFATGVTVIAVGKADDVHAMTANAITSVSLDPPLILACVDYKAKMLPLMKSAGSFSVNILSKEQEGLSRHFANQKLEEVPDFDFDMQFVAPVLKNSLTSLICTVANKIEAGDHTIFIGNVQNIITGEGEPLCFFKGKYAQLVL